MEYTFQNYLTKEEFHEKSGYDLTKRLEIGDLTDSTKAANNFMQDCFDELVNEVIKPNRGIYWTKNFLVDVLSDEAESNEILAEMKKGFIKAFYEHTLYRFEIGDPVACANKDLPRFSEHVIDTLATNRIIFRGV